MKTLFLLILFIPQFLLSQPIRFMTYNILGWSAKNEDGRTNHMKRIFGDINPDIVVMQEVDEEQALNNLRVALTNRQYTMATPYVDGNDSDCGCFYDATKFLNLPAEYLTTSLRNIAKYTLVELSTSDTFRIYTAHLKASDETEDIQQRAMEAQIMYQSLFEYFDKPKNHIIAAGDFNIYSTQEPAYFTLAGIRALPTLIDPVPNNWVRNSTDFLNIYTQATRENGDGNCGGGVGGGMDDRFDYILLSEKLSSRVAKYTAFGNDGKNRLNSSIDNPLNDFGQELAQALRCASDHLPVYVELSPDISSVADASYTEQEAPITYYDLMGNIVEKLLYGGFYIKKQGSIVEKIVFMQE